MKKVIFWGGRPISRSVSDRTVREGVPYPFRILCERVGRDYPLTLFPPAPSGGSPELLAAGDSRTLSFNHALEKEREQRY